jgi:hypothetical protein
MIGREDVVQVVGDAAGERPDAFQALVLEDLRLKELSLRDVGDESLERLARAVGAWDGAPALPHPFQAPVAGADAEGELVGLVALDRPLDQLADGLPVLLLGDGLEGRDAVADQLLGVVACQLAAAAAHELHGPCAVVRGPVGHAGKVAEERADHALLLALLGLDLLAVGDIALGEDEELDAAGGVLGRRGVDLDPEGCPVLAVVEELRPDGFSVQKGRLDALHLGHVGAGALHEPGGAAQDLVRLVAGHLLEGRVDVEDPQALLGQGVGLGHHDDVVYPVNCRGQHIRG